MIISYTIKLNNWWYNYTKFQILWLSCDYAIVILLHLPFTTANTQFIVYTIFIRFSGLKILVLSKFK